MRVVLLIDHLSSVGGGERLAMQIALRLDPERFERTLCASRRTPPGVTDAGIPAAVEDLRGAGVELLQLGRESARDLAAWRPLWERMRAGRVDVLHAHKFGSNVWAAALGSVARVPVVVTHEHTWSFEGQPLRRFLDRELIARRSDAFLSVSREDIRRMIDVEGIDPAKLMFVPNGVPALEGPVSGDDLRGELGIGPADPVIGAVAVLRAQKSLDVLVRAVALLVPEFPDLKVVIAGDGPEREPLAALAEELGVSGAFRWLGERQDAPRVIAALDVAVLSSSFEGSPLAVMEYMRAGKPVVATRVGGVPDLVEDGATGLLAEPGDHAGIAAAVGRLLRDRGLAAELGRRARERQQAEFDLDAMVARLEAMYERLYEDARRAQSRGRRRRAPVSANGREPARLEVLGAPGEAREPWMALAERSRSVFSSWEWADAWWKVYGNGCEPLVTLARRPGGEAFAILPLYVAMSRPARVVRLIGHGPGDELGPVCAPQDREDALVALGAAVEEADRWDLLLAERIGADRDWRAALGAQRLRRDVMPVLRFDGDFEAFLRTRSAKSRKRIRTRERKLLADHDARFRLADDPDRLQDDLTILFRLHAARWAAEGTNAFEGPREAFHRDFAARALERGWLRLWFLEAGGAPVAAWYGFRYGGSDSFYQSGRDPAWDELSVGFVLMMHTIRDTLDSGLHEYRMLLGDEDYKSRFANAVDHVDTLARTASTRGKGLVTAYRAAAHLPKPIRRPLGRRARG